MPFTEEQIRQFKRSNAYDIEELLGTIMAEAGTTGRPGTSRAAIEARERLRGLFEATTGTTYAEPEFNDIIQEIIVSDEPLAAVIHGLAKGASLGLAHKTLGAAYRHVPGAKGLLGEDPEAKLARLQKEHPRLTLSSEFAGTLVPFSTAIKVAHALPWIRRLPPIARATFANTLAGGGLGAMEQKLPEESRLGKIGKEAALFGGITLGLGAMGPAFKKIAKGKFYETMTPTGEKIKTRKLAKAEKAAAGGFPLTFPGTIPEIVAKPTAPARFAQLFVQKEMPVGFQKRMREFKGEAATRRFEAQETGLGLAKGTPAEQMRQKQVISGGLTTRPDLIEVTEKPTQAFKDYAKTLMESPEGVMGKPYHMRLTVKELQGLKGEKLKLGKQLERLKKRGLPITKKERLIRPVKTGEWGKVETIEIPTGELRSPYTGWTEQQELLKGKIGKIDRRILQHYHIGGGGKYGGTQYFPRMYISKEQAQNLTRWGLFRPIRFRGKRTYLKAREDIPDHIRKEMGEIVTAPYPVQKQMTRISGDLATWNLFDDIARNPEWSTISESIAKEKGWVKLTKTPSWGMGALRKSWLRPEVAEEINQLSEIPGYWGQMQDKIVGTWKYMKIIPRPATWGRNIFANFYFVDLAGVKQWSPKAWKTLEQTTKDYVAQGPIRRELVRRGLHGTEFLPVEASFIMRTVKESGGNMFKASWNIFRRGTKGLGDFYTAQDQLFKQWIVQDYLARGATMDYAVEQAFKWMPNYAEVTKFTEKARKSIFGAPFLSFTDQSVRILGVAARERPLTLAKWLMMPTMMTEYSKRKLGFSEEEWREVQRQLPGYMKTGLYPLLPIGNKDEFRLLNMMYMMPWGFFTEHARDPWQFMGNPILTSAATVMTGIDPFTERPVVSDAKPTVIESIKAWADHFGKQITPALTPEIPGTGFKGGFDYQAIKKTVKGIPNTYTLKPIPPKKTIAAVGFGLKTTGFTPEDLKRRHMSKVSGEVYRLGGQLKRVLKERRALEAGAGLEKEIEENKKQEEIIREKIKRVLKDLKPSEYKTISEELKDIFIGIGF